MPRERLPRETVISTGPAECQRSRLHLLANNVRFLILLGIQIRHLASQMLAMTVRGLSAGWTHRYGHPLYLAETFVDLSRVAGTRYRAANWYCVGQT